jgi:hypothetical protein
MDTPATLTKEIRLGPGLVSALIGVPGQDFLRTARRRPKAATGAPG